MGERLANPPLIEALCEFRFRPDTPWDWSVPGRLYERVSCEFSVRAQVEGFGFQFGDKPISTPPQPVRVPDRVQFKRPDGSAMLQVGPRLLIVNQLRPYPGWSAFRELVLRILDEYEAITEPSRAIRVGLRYINRMDASAGFTGLTTLAPALAAPLDRDIQQLYQRYEIEFENPPGNLVHQTGTQTTPEGSFFMLDLDFRSRELGRSPERISLPAWLDAAHEKLHSAFLASLRPEVYERFREGGS